MRTADPPRPTPVRGASAGAAFALALALLVPHPAVAMPPDSAGAARAPRPASGLVVSDVPDDAGRALALTWKPSPDDRPGVGLVARYTIARAPEPGGPWIHVDSVAAGTTDYVDAGVRRNTDYYYRIGTAGPGGETPAGSVTGPVQATSSWFDRRRGPPLVFAILFFALVLYFTDRAQRGAKPVLRRPAAVDAIEEAIAHAAEIGRPVLYLPGTADIDDPQSLAALLVLEGVARLAARHAASLRVPVACPIPFALAEEMVQAGASQAGAEEAAPGEAVRFVSPDPFAFAAAVSGEIARNAPAASLLLGGFTAEALLLAEAGAAAGAAQIAGTASPQQLPFFIVACDHTLIGEELYAASAWLSGDPNRIGSLVASDLMKAGIILVLLAGCALETVGLHGLTAWLAAP